jgi:predicted enzyme related to lactoylglutathione lyase
MQVAAGIGGPEPGPAGHIQSGSTARTSLYIQVADLRTTIDCAIEHGGTELMAPFDIEGGPTLAAISDPEGNHLMLVQQ